MRLGTQRRLRLGCGRFQADENLNAKIIAGLMRREPLLDIQTAATAGILGLDDPSVLATAARDGRILVSHDRETMPGHFKAFTAGARSAGLLIVSQTMELRDAIEQMLLIWGASEAEEWIDQIGYIPLF
jgi:hypothetical protein